MAVQASLSSYRTVAASWGMSRSHKTLRMNKIILPVSYAAINLASVEDPATVGWNFVLYTMIPPTSQMTAPPNEWQVLTQVA